MPDAGPFDARILIVDDEPTNVRVLERLLATAGYRHVHGLTDARQALDGYRTFEPDLILLDLMMPHLDGIAVLELLERERAPDDYLPVLVLTADVTPEAKRRALAAGAKDFLTKPFEVFEVELRIRNLLDTRRLHLDTLRLNRALEAQNRSLEVTVEERTRELRSLFDGVPVGLFRALPDGRLVDVNPAAVAIFGYESRDAMLEIGPAPLYVDPSDRARLLAHLETGDVVRGFECRMFRRGRSIIWVRVSVRAVRDASGRVRHREGALEDVTERREAQDALAESEVRYRGLFDRVPVGLLRALPEGPIQDANPAVVRMLGAATREALVGLNAADFYVDPTEPGRLLDRLRESRVINHHETVWRRLDGTLVPVQLDVTTVVDASGRLAHLESAVQDLTERRRVEEEMRRQREALHQSEKVATMGSLLAGVAHELNNPLAVVMGQTHLLRESGGDAKAADRAGKIHAAAERCGRIVKNFLALARQRPPERNRVDINQVVREAAELLAYELRSGGVEVALDLGETVPRLWADGHQLHQVFVNLLVNAHHAMRRQATPRRITVRTRAARGRVEIEVADTGPGVPPEVRDQIFQPFFTTKPAGEGTGLGLSLCRNVVEEHEGTIALASEGGQGAWFTITLPVLAPPAMTERAEPAETIVPPIGRRSILVVDDEPDITGVLAEAFSRDGHEVDVAHDGAAALERIGQRSYDLVVTDSKMPGMDGADFYREMARRNPEIRGRIIFVTGDVLDREKLAFLESTGAPFLPKPFDVAEVRRVAYRLMTRARGPSEPGPAAGEDSR